ncbi:hypothetical protein AZI86_13225 [Bdellovibrio bacteriovorus]|uniref:Uncharacterized protein n=1 Tax=Bdellovibrio bacteriovorus TaxID=959 RepID=A0A150WJ48_BDEBC|nr:hypothetical protein [Bdellovibrio bacteriovorus]KYG63779.1 hypothetical protein AZI86_13225 [Bdellovibrio bacteriovorus]
MGQFKEIKIEETDVVLQDIDGVKNLFHQQDESVDVYSLFLPHFDEELGGLLPHEKHFIPAARVLDSLK